MKSTAKKDIFLWYFILLIIIFLPLRLWNIRQPINLLTEFRQAQTATVALNYYHNGIDLLRSELDFFGKGPEKYLTLEFPLYEAIVAIFYKIFWVQDYWGKIISVLAGFIGAYYLYRLVYLVFRSRKLAFLTCFFYLSFPINMYHQKDFLIENTVICFLIAGLFYFVNWFYDKKSINLLYGSILLSLGFIQKIMYGPFLLLPIIWLQWKKNKLWSKSGLLITALLFPFLVIGLWQNHVDRINTSYGHEYFTSTNKAQILWNIGTFSDRLSIPMWDFRLKNLLNGIFLKPGIPIFIIGLIVSFFIKEKGFVLIWFLAEVIYYLTFFKIQSHIYYEMVITPVIAIIMAIGILYIGKGIVRLLHRLKKTEKQDYLIAPIFISLFCSIFLWRTWMSSQWNSQVDYQWLNRIKLVGKSVPINSTGIFISPGYDWNSVYTYIPKLKLKLVTVDNVNEIEIKKWIKDGYSYIILHDYREYDAYLKDKGEKFDQSVLKNFNKILDLEDFQVYLVGELNK